MGVLGGTFDPIHLGHLAIAEEARDALGLRGVLFVPAAVPPHRGAPTGASAEDRAAMVELAIAGNPFFHVDRLELARSGPSYSVDTLTILADRERASGREPDLWFILSAEALAGLPTWRSPARILELARLAVVPRPGASVPDRAWLEEQFPGCGDRVRFVDGPLLPVSGTAVRARAAAGRSLRYLVPDAVRSYIADHDLYRS
jgi:nicotinate-nucleotide adenylyltransferase